MKKNFIILLFCLIAMFGLYAQEDGYSPMYHGCDYDWIRFTFMVSKI